MKIQLEVDFGSKFQREVGEIIILEAITSIKKFLELRHKKNKVSVKYNNEPLIIK